MTRDYIILYNILGHISKASENIAIKSTQKIAVSAIYCRLTPFLPRIPANIRLLLIYQKLESVAMANIFAADSMRVSLFVLTQLCPKFMRNKLWTRRKSKI